ncbi:MAG TPA: hypothetical protein VKA76_08585 [Gammaproteobacteria bacterium]|nr:hypothetical protein [Gammaproteobacteria bacterium]
MSNVVPFRRPKASEKHQGNTLCKRGFHKWEEVPTTPFEVKTGRLVTRYRCARCGATRVETT